MFIELQKITSSKKETLKNLFEFYTYEFSEYMDLHVDDHGRYGYPPFDNYFTDPCFDSFFIIIEGKLAGFAIVKQDDLDTYSINQFFIMKKFRKSGAGRIVAVELFDRYRGEWKVAQIMKNIPAQHFWRKVISSYTNGNYTETIRQDQEWRGPVQEFSNARK